MDVEDEVFTIESTISQIADFQSLLENLHKLQEKGEYRKFVRLKVNEALKTSPFLGDAMFPDDVVLESNSDGVYGAMGSVIQQEEEIRSQNDGFRVTELFSSANGTDTCHLVVNLLFQPFSNVIEFLNSCEIGNRRFFVRDITMAHLKEKTDFELMKVVLDAIFFFIQSKSFSEDHDLKSVIDHLFFFKNFA